MTEAPFDPQAPRQAAQAALFETVPPPLLARLLEAVGVEGLATAEWDGSVEGRSPEEPTSWQQRLEEACAPHPLRLRPVFLSAREAIASANPHTPLISYAGTDDSDSGWVTLLDRVGDRARRLHASGSTEWLAPPQLAEQLGQTDPDVPVAWVVLEASLPNMGASSHAAHHHGKLPPFGRLARLVRPDRSDLASIVVYAVVIGALTLATPIAVQQLVNTVAFGGLVQPVVVLALLLFAGLAFAGLLSALQFFVAETVQRRVFVRVAVDLSERLPRVSSDAFDRAHGPEIVNRIFDVFTVQKTGAALMLEGTSVVLQTVVGLVVLSFYHPLMLGFSILLIGGIFLVAFVFGRGAVDTAIGESHAKYAAVGWMEELARHPRAFRHPAGRRYATERGDRLAAGWIQARRRHYRIVFRQLSSALALQVIASSGLLALGGGLVVAGQLTLGQLVASELIITAIVAAVAKLGKQLESFYDLLAAVDKLGVLFDLPLEPESGSISLLGDTPASVEFRDVTFGHGSRRVLDGISFHADPGERILLRGPSGSGKSTVLDLLLRLRTPDAGHVAIDGHDLRDVHLGDLREQVVCVRDPEIFSATVLDNMRIARPGLSSADVTKALNQVGMLDDIRSFPDGLQTHLSTDGAPLSNGQIAGLMIARAVAARPRLLLLDSAFVALEPSARKPILDTIFADDAPWTVIVASDLPDIRGRCTRSIELPGPAYQDQVPEPEDAS